ncbi:DNA-processing protein DprA [Paraburkholderia kururiensis]|uniref:DNA-processing protein DprA n=1 Tax=Paraburkholderia kururiensis TaxID=984307 RepID=A0ABZ0WUT9_9BURK|nr:DNA-processing protein DprA [Paraburkholderia kururiensis]WQD81086.1 DNA-processing protein DprA [Paraburkholderia kururiensis]
MHSLPMTDAELIGWLRLSCAPGVPPAALRKLLQTFGLPEAVLAQSFAALASATDTRTAQAVLAAPGPAFAEQASAALAWREEAGNWVLTLCDPAYPPMLLTMPDPPPLLYIKGQLDSLHRKAVAVVGSRSATPQGTEDAARFARAFSEAGLTVVSGLALGIDGAAHRGALTGLGGTVAVIGTGIDIVYPPSHRTLAAQIAEQGAIVSEWPLGTPARPSNFPQRNRLIAGLSSGVLVVEAAMRSGSLITARLANEMGRDVFALPGSIHAPLSKGCHRMLKQGAMLVETAEEVLEQLGVATAPRPGPAVVEAKATATRSSRSRDDRANGRSGAGESAEGMPSEPSPQRTPSLDNTASPLTPDAQRLLDALGHAPATLEILAQRTEMEEAALQRALLYLELAGRVTALPGGRFTRASRD